MRLVVSAVDPTCTRRAHRETKALPQLLERGKGWGMGSERVGEGLSEDTFWLLHHSSLMRSTVTTAT